MTFYNRIDSVLLDKLLPGNTGEIQAGIYAHAYRILEATNQISFLFAVLLLPLFSHLIKSKEIVDLTNIARVSFSLLFVGTLILAISSYFYSYEIMDLLYDEHILASSQVYSYIIFGVIAMSTSYVFATLLTANGDLKALNLIALGSVLISLILNVVLVPSMLAKGSAIANVSALFFSTVLQLLVVYNRFKLSFGINFYIKLALFVIFSILVFLIIHQFIMSNWLNKFLISAILSLITAVLLRLLNMKEFIRVIKTREE